MAYSPKNAVIILALIGIILVGSVLSQQSSTTAAPAPAPAPAPTPTPTPTPSPTTNCTVSTTKPGLVAQSYVFKTCIVAKFAAYYTVGANQYIELKNGRADNASYCEQASGNQTTPAKLVVTFDCGQIEFGFGKDDLQVFVSDINGKYTFNGTQSSFKNSSVLFKSANDHYYKCNSEQTVASDDKKSSLVFNNLAFEAYRGNTTGTEFFKVPEECALDSSQVSDLVRIGVGICLVALVALVLVAYFVGRRRWSERSSYESV